MARRRATSHPRPPEPEARRVRARLVRRRLARRYPGARTALHYRNPLELLAAVILSAQCTDKKVNEVTPALFRRYRSAAAYAAAPPGELERLVHATGFFRAKARALRGLGRELALRHGGRVPRTMEELVALPGVGRKTANVVLDQAFGVQAGLAVDTHVTRLSRLLGLTAERTPERIEADLTRLLPQKDWGLFSHLLIAHGRAVCRAGRPDCAGCVLNEFCPSAFRSERPARRPG